MKVKELIKILENYPKDRDVYIYDHYHKKETTLEIYHLSTEDVLSNKVLLIDDRL